MEALNARQRGSLVEALGSAVFHGGTAIGDVPALLRRVLETGAWREFETPTHEVVTYTHFEEFVDKAPPRGLSADMALVRRMVADDPVTVDLLNKAVDPVQGRHHNNVMMSEQGNSKAYTLRRLSKDRPELHKRVLAGELSPHAAMIEAGFRHRMVSMPVDDVARLARTLRTHLDPDQVRALRDLLG